MRRTIILITFLLIFSLLGTAAAENTTDHEKINILILNPPHYARHSVEATYKIYEEYPQYKDKFNITVRTGEQISKMSSDDLTAMIKSSDIIIVKSIGHTMETYTKLVNTLKSPGVLTNDKLFVHLRCPEGVDSVKLSQIDGKKIFEGIPDQDIYNVSAYTQISDNPLTMLSQYVNKYPQIQKWAKLYSYYCYPSTENDKNLILCAIDMWAKYNKKPVYVKYDEVKVFSRHVIYRNGKFYNNLTEYFKDYPLNPQKPTVGIIELDSYVALGGTAGIDSLIEKLTTKGYNVIPVVARYGYETYAGIVEFFTTAKSVKEYESNPDSVKPVVDIILAPHTYLLGGPASKNVVALLQRLNIPVIKIIQIESRSVKDWLISDDGLTPWSRDDIAGQLVFPESQGLIEPIAIAALDKRVDPLTGCELSSYSVIDERVSKVVSRVEKWLQLKIKPNKDKKIAIIYENGVGKWNIGTSYLNLPESIINILNKLKEAGYTIDKIPNVEEFVEILRTKGINVAPWAPGELEKLANNSILWEAEKYKRWFSSLNPIAQKYVVEGPLGYIEEIIKFALNYSKKDPGILSTATKVLDKWYKEMRDCIKMCPNKSQRGLEILDKIVSTLRSIINGTSTWEEFYRMKKEFMLLNITGLAGWGEPPGNLMTIVKNGTKYIVIPGIIIGNVFIGPEPILGYEGNPDALLHALILPPHHQYLAFYAWINKEFNADAMIHIGVDTTYQHLPRKQTALLDFDFPDIVIGDTPNIHLYRVDNVADGLLIKRRGYGVIIDYLTPPMKLSGLYGDLLNLKTLLENYKKAIDENLKKAYIQDIKKLIERSKIEINTNLSDEELIKACSDYLIKIETTLMPYGLHTFGKEWTADEIAETVASMLSIDGGVDNPSIIRLLAQEKGISYENITPEMFDELYNQVKAWIKDILLGKNITVSQNITKKLELGKDLIDKLKQSFNSELNSLLNVLNGGYVAPQIGGDPIVNPNVLPTGKNFYATDPTLIPTQSAYELGKKIADLALKEYEKPPEKLAVVIFGVDVARDDGAMVSFVLRLLGVEPTWAAGGRVSGIKLTPLTTLNRPRIDAIVMISGLFRDAYGQVAVLLDRAFRLALAASYNTIARQYNDTIVKALDAAVKPLVDLKLLVKGDDPIDQNYVAKHWLESVQKYIASGVEPEKAGNYAILRIVGPPAGGYGTGIKEAIDQPWTWKNETDLSNIFINRMSNFYSETTWGEKNTDLFKDLLSGVSGIYQGRSTYVVGVAENDAMASYLGGLAMTIRVLTGETPKIRIAITSNKFNPEILSLSDYIARDLRTRYFNPEFIKALMSEGQAGAYRISTFIESLKIWQTTVPGEISSDVYKEFIDVYLRDKYNLGISNWLNNNPFDQIHWIGTLLTLAHQNRLKLDANTMRFLMNRWAALIARYGPACCDCSCGNIAMIRWALNYVNPDLLNSVRSQLYIATKNAAFAPSIPGAPTTPQPSIPGIPTSIPGAPSQLGAPTALGRVGIGTAATRGVSPGISGPSGRVGGEIGARGAAQAAGAAGKAGITGAAAGKGAGKAYEITPVSKGIGKPGIPFAGIIGVIILIALIAAGYLLRRPEK